MRNTQSAVVTINFFINIPFLSLVVFRYSSCVHSFYPKSNFRTTSLAVFQGLDYLKDMNHDRKSFEGPEGQT